jgi:hypothetical protein
LEMENGVFPIMLNWRIIIQNTYKIYLCLQRYNLYLYFVGGFLEGFWGRVVADCPL